VSKYTTRFKRFALIGRGRECMSFKIECREAAANSNNFSCRLLDVNVGVGRTEQYSAKLVNMHRMCDV